MLSLRMATGVDRATALGDGFGAAIAWGEEHGLLVGHPDDAERVQLTMRGRLLSNELFARIV